MVLTSTLKLQKYERLPRPASCRLSYHNRLPGGAYLKCEHVRWIFDGHCALKMPSLPPQYTDWCPVTSSLRVAVCGATDGSGALAVAPQRAGRGHDRRARLCRL